MTASVLSKARRFGEGADRVLSALEQAILVALFVVSVLALVVDILLRVFAGLALAWAAELTRYCIVWMVFIGGSQAARKGAHITIDLLIEVLPQPMIGWLARTVLSVSGAGCAVLAVLSWQLVAQMMNFRQLSPSLEWPMWVVYLALPLGFSLMTLRFGQQAFSEFKPHADRAHLQS